MSVVCPHPLDTLGALESGRIMLEGQMGLYEYARYIRTVTEGRSIVFQCDKGNAVLGETLLFVAEFCRHPSRTAIGRLRNGTIKLESFMGAFDYSDYVRFVGDSRRIVYECDKGYYLQGRPRPTNLALLKFADTHTVILAGPPKATCVNGQWKPNVAPKCVSQTHPLVEGRIVWDRTKRTVSSALTFVDTAASSLVAPLAVGDDSCPALYDNRRQKLAVIRLNRREDGRFPHGSHLMVRRVLVMRMICSFRCFVNKVTN
jgi:hypothetical protein